MRLLAVEVRRLRARSLLLALVLVAVGVIGLVVAAAWSSARPLTAEQLEEAQRQYQFALEDWEENGEQMIADCREQEEREEEISGQDVDFGCDAMTAPQEEWFIPQSTELAETFPMLLSGTAMLVVLVALLLGTTSTAAEMSSGSMSTWLTFVPQRLRVLFSKIGAAVVVAVPVAVVLLAVLVAGLYVVHAMQGALGDLDGDVWADVAWTCLRVTVLSAVIAGVGAALGVLLRHTAAVIGAVVGWVLVVESILAGLVPTLSPFLVRTGVAGVVGNGTAYYVTDCEVTSQGTMCESTEVLVTFGQSALLIGVVTALVVGVTALVFRRRDVG